MSNILDNNKIIVALDYNSKKQALELSKKLDPSYCRLKIGKQLFTKYGPTIVNELQKMNFEIFDQRCSQKVIRAPFLTAMFRGNPFREHAPGKMNMRILEISSKQSFLGP